jgi:hypothetical protein
MDALDTKCRQLNERRGALTQRIIKAEGNNHAMFAPVPPETKARLAAASKMLNGSAPKGDGKSAGEGLDDLHEERRAIDLALKIADQQRTELQAIADVERREATEEDWVEIQKQIALCIVNFERVLLARDAIWLKRQPLSVPEPHPNQNWRFYPRLSQRGGAAFEFLCNAAAQGWLDAKTYAEILKETKPIT